MVLQLEEGVWKKMEYKFENFENEDHEPLDKFFDNPVLIKINELSREGWEVVTIIPWEIEGYKEYMVWFKKR